MIVHDHNIIEMDNRTKKGSHISIPILAFWRKCESCHLKIKNAISSLKQPSTRCGELRSQIVIPIRQREAANMDPRNITVNAFLFSLNIYVHLISFLIFFQYFGIFQKYPTLRVFLSRFLYNISRLLLLSTFELENKFRRNLCRWKRIYGQHFSQKVS